MIKADTLRDSVLTQAPVDRVPRAHGPHRHILRKRTLPWRRFGTYTGAGIISGVVNLALFHLAREDGLNPHLAWALAFEVGALVAFMLHRHITWREHRVRTMVALVRQLIRAQAGTLIALLANLIVFTLCVRAGFPGDLDDAVGLGIGFIVNFALAHHFIYGSHRYREGWHRSGRTRSRAGALHR